MWGLSTPCLGCVGIKAFNGNNLNGLGCAPYFSGQLYFSSGRFGYTPHLGIRVCPGGSGIS